MPGSGWARPGRRWSVVLAAAIGCAMVGAAPAGAQPAGTRVPVQPAGGGYSATITLITGDRVRYTEDASGRTTVAATPGAGRARHTFRGSSDAKGYYLVPDDAEQYVTSGLLDRELFDVKYLAHHGYGDADTSTLPVIVGYGRQVAAQAVPQRAAQLAGVAATRALPAVHGESVAVDKRNAAGFFASVTGGTAPTVKPALAGGVAKVWLDRKVTVRDDGSNAQIGAPTAWAAGYDGSGVKVAILDTGIDATHPDLRNRVVDSHDFVPGDAGVTDHFGHGTHVASIIAGSGAASAGKYQGVAPGAQLVIGKVLGDDGSGDESWIIEGMQWAAGSGAKVISMSLGSDAPSDGTDPMSQAVDDLTASTGVLFVIAAGNSGPGDETIGEPGAADAALTVAAVSKTDQLAGFSSRGPRSGDSALKPDIAGPGVDIVAARAAGTSMGTPLDQYYTSASGTSMATPHVAAAAAILAEQHPDWTAADLKPALMSTSHDDGYTPYEQGAGRLDLGRAVTQQVYATTANLDFGVVHPGDSGGGRQVGYRNLTGQPLTLTLAATLRDADGKPAPAGALTADSTVTVPAGGTATATVTLAPAALAALGRYSGTVVATGPGGVALTVPVGVLRQPPLHKISITVLGPAGGLLLAGGPAFGAAKVDDRGVQPEAYPIFLFRAIDGPNRYDGSAMIPEGVYDLSQIVDWMSGAVLNMAYVGDPEFTLDRDRSITFDMNKAVPITVHTPKPTEGVDETLGWTRTTQGGTTYATSVSGVATGYGMRLLAVPGAKRPTLGSAKLFTDHILAAPQLGLTLRGGGRGGHTVQVRPSYLTDFNIVPKFHGDERLAVATQDDLLAGRDVRGKLVLIGTGPHEFPDQLLGAAVKAGAAAVLDHSDGGDMIPVNLLMPQFADIMTIPFLWVDNARWDALSAALGDGRHATVDIHTQPVTPYEYKLHYYAFNTIRAADLDHRPRTRDLTELRTEYHGQVPAVDGRPNMDEVNSVFRPEDHVNFLSTHGFSGPVARTEYYGQTGRDTMWVRQYTFYDNADGALPRNVYSVRAFSTPSRGEETWNQAPVAVGQQRPGPQWDGGRAELSCSVCRLGDTVYLVPYGIAANDPTQLVASDGTLQVGLYEGDLQIPWDRHGLFYPHYVLDPAAATYTLKTVYQDGWAGQKTAKTVSTDWTFRSAHVGAATVTRPYQCTPTLFGVKDPCGWQPLLQLGYDLDLSLTDSAPAGGPYRFTVSAWQPQPGGPKVTGLRVSVSYDDGRSWTPAAVSARHDGTYQVLLFHPPLAATTGAVSLKTEAWDAAGDRVVQRIDRAYTLTGR